MNRFWISGLFVLGLTLPPSFALAASDSPAPPPAAVQPQPVSIEGFRSAHFGMSESDVRAAIKKDLSGSEVARVNNDIERTTVLTTTAKDLLPSAPPATVSYILGATSAKLIHINIAWGGNTGDDIAELLPTAKTLVAYFSSLGAYAKDSIVVNQNQPDGSVLLFRGADPKGHTILMFLVPVRDPAADPKAKTIEVKKAILRLSYVESPQKEDVFRVEKGQF